MRKACRTALIGIGLALPFLFLFWPALFGNRAFTDGDAVLQMYPAAYSLQQALQTGESFSWNPHILTGFPMAASFVGGFFSPLYHVIFRYFDIFTMYHVLTVLNFIIAAWLTYFVCRLLKLSTASSLFAGITFPLGTAYWLFGSNLTVTSGFPLIPGLLVATLLINRSKALFTRIVVTLVSGTIVGLLLLQAHPQWPVMAIILAIAFAIYLDITNKSAQDHEPKIPNHKSQITNKLQIQNPKFQTNNSKVVLNFGNWSLRFIWNLMLEIWCFFKTLITSLRTTYWLLLTFLIGILISLPQLIASTRIGGFSARGAGITLSNAVVGSLLPADLLSLLLPNLNIPFLMQKPYLLYMGAVPLLLAIISFALPKSKHYRFFFWTFILCLLIAVKYSPLFWVIHQLPILNAFREPSRFMYIGLFAFTMIATFGFEKLTLPLSSRNLGEDERRGRLERIVKWLMRFSVTLVSLVALSSITIAIWRTQLLNVLTSYFDTHLYASTTKLPLEHYHNVIQKLFDQITNGMILNNVPTTIGVLSVLLGSLLIWWYVNKQKDLSSRALTRDPNTNNQNKKNLRSFLFSFGFLDSRFHGNDKIRIVFSASIILLTLLSGIGVKIGTLRTVPRNLIETPPATASVIQSQSNDQPYRVFAFLPGASVYQELDAKYGYQPEANIETLKNLLSPNLNLFYEIDSLDYYDDLMDRRGARLLRYLGSNRGTFGESLTDMNIPFEEKKRLFLDRLPLLSMANVKYITSLYPLEHPRLKLLTESRVTRYALRVFLYENLDVMPRYYLTNDNEITPVLSEEESWENLLRQKTVNKKQLTVTVIECDSCDHRLLTNFAMAKNVRQSDSDISITPTNQTNTEYTFELETGTDQWFVFGQNNLPGWNATVDGVRTEIYRANFLFQAIRVPEGKHMVELRYTL